MNTESDVVLQLENVCITYKMQNQLFNKKKLLPIDSLVDIDLKLHRSDRLGVIGRNGAGKSTLMKVLSGIVSPDKGKMVKSAGVSIQLLSLGVGMEGNLTGRENAVLNGMLLGKSRKYMLERVEKIKDFSELGHFFEYPVSSYSSGMVARLGFSVALEINPDVLLIDEVLGVGDVNFYHKSYNALRERIDSGKAFILISHQASMIQELCTRAIWLEKGRVIMQGSTNEVCAQYASCTTHFSGG